jgi:uncharacterized protein
MDVFFLYYDQTFVWDASKASENRVKHGVEFEDACEAFFDEASLYVDATRGDEQRVAVIGMDEKARLLYVVHIERERQQVRVISAREATKRERRIYEDG